MLSAVRNENVEDVKKILDANKELTVLVKDNTGDNALDTARKRKRLETVNFKRQYLDKEWHTFWNEMMHALIDSLPDGKEKVLEFKKDVVERKKQEDFERKQQEEERRQEIELELFVACEKNDINAVNKLLEDNNDININQPQTNGSTCLAAACEQGHLEIVKRLLLVQDIQIQTTKDQETTLQENDQVEAKCDGWTRYFKGKITNVNSDGSYDITFEDGERKRGVEKNKIKVVHLIPIEIAKENGHDAIVVLLTEYNNTKEKEAENDSVVPFDSTSVDDEDIDEN